MGQSGCGKSSLLRAIAGAAGPTGFLNAAWATLLICLHTPRLVALPAIPSSSSRERKRHSPTPQYNNKHILKQWQKRELSGNRAVDAGERARERAGAGGDVLPAAEALHAAGQPPLAAAVPLKCGSRCPRPPASLQPMSALTASTTPCDGPVTVPLPPERPTLCPWAVGCIHQHPQRVQELSGKEGLCRHGAAVSNLRQKGSLCAGAEGRPLLAGRSVPVADAELLSLLEQVRLSGVIPPGSPHMCEGAPVLLCTPAAVASAAATRWNAAFRPLSLQK